MQKVIIFLFVLSIQNLTAQVILDADGPGNTYELITSVLAPGQNPIEVPDCNHNAFGDHIDEVFDDELNEFVFRFHIHTTPDNDRCQNFDRQRNEIKSYAPSPDNLLGIEGEIVRYKWKFKLDDGFQPSPNFTHLHQLKAVGGEDSSPMYTLTCRKSNPDRLELRYAETDTQITLDQTPLEPFIGNWIEVDELVRYGFDGFYQIQLTSVETGEALFTYETNEIINWRTGNEFVRPKWGIYRSLINEQDLRDEMVWYANFSIEEIAPSNSNNIFSNSLITVYHNRTDQSIQVSDLPPSDELIEIYTVNGQLKSTFKTNQLESLILDVSDLSTGIYVIVIQGKRINFAKKLVVF